MTEPLKPFGRQIDGLAYGMLHRDGRIACARVGYGPYTYDLPGGGIDPGETPEMAVIGVPIYHY